MALQRMLQDALRHAPLKAVPRTDERSRSGQAVVTGVERLEPEVPQVLQDLPVIEAERCRRRLYRAAGQCREPCTRGNELTYPGFCVKTPPVHVIMPVQTNAVTCLREGHHIVFRQAARLPQTSRQQKEGGLEVTFLKFGKGDLDVGSISVVKGDMWCGRTHPGDLIQSVTKLRHGQPEHILPRLQAALWRAYPVQDDDRVNS